jgi:hypothetical protein
LLFTIVSQPIPDRQGEGATHNAIDAMLSVSPYLVLSSLSGDIISDAGEAAFGGYRMFSLACEPPNGLKGPYGTQRKTPAWLARLI